MATSSNQRLHFFLKDKVILNYIEDNAQTTAKKEPGPSGSKGPSTQPKKNLGQSGSGETSNTSDESPFDPYLHFSSSNF